MRSGKQSSGLTVGCLDVWWVYLSIILDVLMNVCMHTLHLKASLSFNALAAASLRSSGVFVPRAAASFLSRAAADWGRAARERVCGAGGGMGYGWLRRRTHLLAVSAAHGAVVGV